MKKLLLFLFIGLSYTAYSQSGQWTKNSQPLMAKVTYNESVNTISTPNNFKGKSPKKQKTDLELQKEIATRQNIEIEEILAENEKQRQQIELLLVEISKLKAEVEALKKEEIE